MRRLLVITILLFGVVALGYFYIYPESPESGNNQKRVSASSVNDAFVAQAAVPPKNLPKYNNVRAIHLAYAAYFSDRYEGIVEQVENSSELNAIVFEIKDPLGRVAFNSDAHNARTKEVINDLHRRGIYAIARMVIFQDPALVGQNPSLGIRNSATGAPWSDYKGIVWSDPTSRAVWQYNVDIAQEAVALGFDEVNFDYIRFPTDGPLQHTEYSNLAAFGTKKNTIKRFVAFAREELGPNVILSADVFGMTFLSDQLVIGQAIGEMDEYLDVIAPMPYPSHYPDGFRGFANPADHPYAVLHFTLERGLQKLDDPSVVVRPWLQDFDLGANYGPAEIRAQIKASNDVLGHNSWWLWNASNRYTHSAF